MRGDFIQSRQRRLRLIQTALVSLLTLGSTTLGHAQAGQQIVLPEGLSQSAVSQITELENEKASRTPAQNKVDSQLLYANQQRGGTEKANAVRSLQVNVGMDSEGGVLVDVDGTVSLSLLKQITKLGGEVVNSFPQYNTLRARLPLEAIESLAANPAVRFIKPAVQFELEGHAAGTGALHPVPMVPTASRVSRDARLRAALPGILQQVRASRAAARSASSLSGLSPLDTMLGTSALFQMRDGLMAQFALRPFQANVAASTGSGSVDSEGDATHRAIQARSQFGATGAGIRVGILSDSIDDTSGSYAAALASGDVSPVTVIPGQAGTGEGEGLAMCEIVHDLAPGAELYYATANGGPAQFAQNIRDLRAAGCDVIIDDVGYFNESPFQDDIISQAVLAVTGSGALYFSSASNSGSVRAKTAGTWEGDFKDGGPATGAIAGSRTGGKGYRLHLFTGTDQLTGAPLSQTFNAFPAAPPTGGGTRYGELFWADPLGGSNNDYDLFFLNAAGTAVQASSTNSQTGTQDPYEIFAVPALPAANPSYVNKRFVIVKAASAAPRFLHFDTGRGYITIATNGVTRGHSAVPAAFSTAATPASAPAATDYIDPATGKLVITGRIAAVPGPFPGPFTGANTTESFSSDGPRHVFFNVDGSPITPGDFSSTGGSVRLKPDITAANGVSTTLPGASGLNPFYGTSAAAPHAGAIAALLKSYNYGLTPAQVRSILTGPAAIDIDEPGYDVTSGYGIVDAVNALGATTANPDQYLSFTLASLFIHGGTSTTGTVTLRDPAPAGGTTFKLTSSNPSVASVPASVTVPQGQTSATFTITTPLAATTQTTSITAATAIQSKSALLTVQAQYNISGRVLSASGFGIPGAVVSTRTFGDTAPTALTATPTTPIAIPDATATANGAAVTLPITFGASGLVSNISVGLDITHTYRGDLLIALFAPDGKYVILKNPSADDTPNYKTTIPVPTPSDNPLSTLYGKPLKGTWTLYVQDTGPSDVGTLNSFSLNLTPAETTTDSTGAYLFQDLTAATYPLTASAGFGFVPTTQNVTIGPDAIQNFTLAPAGVRSSATVTRGSDYVVTLNLSSAGVPASNVVLTKASLGSAQPTSPTLPVTVGTIPANGSTTVVLHFPLSAGAAGTTVLLRDSGTNTGGAFSGTLAVKLPASSS